jgi:heptosyltransferase-2
MGPRALIIKLAALGDVARTAALLPGLTRMFGEPPHVTWLTAPAAADLVRRMPGVDVVLPFGEESLARLRVERFDAMICLDKEPGPCAVASTVAAAQKFGIGLSRYGTPEPINVEAETYFELGLNDEEKFFNNRKSYQQLIYEAVGLDYRGERFEIEPTEADRAAAAARLKEIGADPARRWVGIHPGAGGVFAYKAWRESGHRALIEALIDARRELGVLLFGGPPEAQLLDRLRRGLDPRRVVSTGTDNSLGTFLALLDSCVVVVCADSLALHLAVARRRRVVATFGPTCEQEIDLFGLGVKIKSPIECSPCYRRTCDKSPTCQDLIEDARAIEAVLGQLAATESVASP